MSMTQTAFRAVVTAGAALALSATVAHAAVMVQAQSESQSMEVSASTTGTGTATAQASGSQSQSQVQIMDSAPMQYVYPRAQYVKGKYVRPVAVRTKYVRSNWVTPVVMADGQVRLSWGYRGGTCQVRYTEATRNWYAYATAAGCDDGGVTINGLEPGKKYRFQVRPENGAWSQAVVVRAD